MGQAANIRAGGAFVELFTKNNLLEKGLKAAEAKVRAFGSAITGIGLRFAALGAMIWAPLLGAAKKYAESGSELLLMSQRTGIAVDALSQLKFAAGQAGIAGEDLETGLKKMDQTIQKAADGDQKAIESLKSMGLTIADLANLKPDEMFERLASGVAAIENPVTRNARILEVFGKSGLSLAPLLAKGAEGIKALREEADRLGLTKSLQSVQNAMKLRVALNAVEKSLGSVYNAVGGAIAPLLTYIANSIVPLLQRVRSWVKENKAVLNALVSIGGTVTFIGAGLLAIGGAIKLIAMVLSPITAIVSLASSLIAGTLSLVGFLLTPLGLIVGLMGAAGYAFFRFTDAGKGVLSTLGGGFTNLASIAKNTWQGISAAIAAGDWAGAIEIAWLGIKSGTQSLIGTLKVAWLEFRNFFLGIWDTIADGEREKYDWLKTAFDVVTGRAGANSQLQEAIEKSYDQLAKVAASYRDAGTKVPKEITEAMEGLVAQSIALNPQAPQSSAAGNAASRDDELETLRRANARAQRQLEKALTARTKRELDWERATRGMGTGMESWKNNFSNAVDQSRAKTDVAGTFSAVAAGLLGASSIDQQQLEQLRVIAANTSPNNNQPLMAT